MQDEKSDNESFHLLSNNASSEPLLSPGISQDPPQSFSFDRPFCMDPAANCPLDPPPLEIGEICDFRIDSPLFCHVFFAPCVPFFVDAAENSFIGKGV